MGSGLLALLCALQFAVAAFSGEKKEAEEYEDMTFQCVLHPEVDVSDSPVTWFKDDRRNIVHASTNGRDRADDQMEEFRNRTLLLREGMSKGIVTLQLLSVRLSDSGRYRCYIRRTHTYCYFDLRVVKKSHPIRPRGTFSNKTSLENDPGGESRSVCDVKYTVISIFCGAFGAVILMILGMYLICKKIQTKMEKKKAEGTNTEMQTLSAEGREGGSRPTSAAGRIEEENDQRSQQMLHLECP